MAISQAQASDLLRLRYKILCEKGSLGPYCRKWGVEPKFIDGCIRGQISPSAEEVSQVIDRLESGLLCV